MDAGPWGSGDLLWLVTPRQRVARRRLEQAHPLGLVVPTLGQVQRDMAAAVVGDARGDADQVAADGRAASRGVEGPSQRVGGAVRLWQMAAQVSQVALTGKCPDGR